MLSPLRAGCVFAKLAANQKGLAAYADLTTTVSSGTGIRPSYAQFQPPYWQVPRFIEQHDMPLIRLEIEIRAASGGKP